MRFWEKFTTEIYCIRINELEEGDDIFDLSRFQLVKNITPPVIAITDTRVICADPFLFVKDDHLFLFYEDLKRYGGKGVIRMIRTKNMHDWTKPVTVLSEDFHLSFPYVFEDGDGIYMIPETYQDLSVRLYKGNEDLTEWIYVKTLLKGEKYVDSFVFIHEGTYFLFAPIELSDFNYLQNLYYSDSILGEWKLHPSSPIAQGKETGRNGGAVFCYAGKIYRPAQNCAIRYGGNIGICSIETLLVNNYKEILVYPDIVPKNSYYSMGGHHFCYTRFNGKTVIATDAVIRSVNIKNLWCSFKRKSLEFYHNSLNRSVQIFG